MELMLQLKQVAEETGAHPGTAAAAAGTSASAATHGGNSSSRFTNNKPGRLLQPRIPLVEGSTGGSGDGEVMFNLCISRAAAINRARNAALQVREEEEGSYRNNYGHVACQ